MDATGVYLFKKVALNNTTIAHEMRLYFSIALLLLGVIAENMLSKSIKLRDTTLARIGFVINIALLAIVVAPAAGMWIVTHTASLFNKVDSFNAVQWFENVHW